MLEFSSDSALYLTDVSPGDKPWDSHRASASTVQTLYSQAGESQYASRIQQCSRSLGFALEAQDSGDFKLKLREARFCRVRHCPVCQWRRSLMWRARLFSALPSVLEAHPKGRWVFLTLTVKNCPLQELRATVREMNKAWNRLTVRKAWPALGFIRSTEVTRGADGSAHPHFHCLLLVKSSYFGSGYLKQADWVELWKQAMRLDYDPIVDVRAVKSPSSRAADQSGLTIALLETLKYGVKPTDLTADSAWLAELTSQLHKTRAVSVGGVLKDHLSEDEPEDLILAEDQGEEAGKQSEAELWFGWREMANRYAKTNIGE
jgi:plasmid rolling circle replication initiator protein Rep